MKSQCRKCGQWYTSRVGGASNYWCPPAGYDDSLCPTCNQEIDTRERMERETGVKPTFT